MTEGKERNFEEWLATMQAGIETYDYYTDFSKVVDNVDDMLKVRLNMLNSLIGSKNVEQDFRTLAGQYPEVCTCIPIMLAVRKSRMCGKKTVIDEPKIYEFEGTPNVDDCVEFMRETGLMDFIQNRMCANFVDYVYGVETGMDTNGRKNRSGKLMENLIAHYLEEAGLILNETYFKQKTVSAYGRKKFDFVVLGKNTTYVIETNYYSDGGSKVSEICRSYESVDNKMPAGLTFIWITDGQGWVKTSVPLKERFDAMGDRLWNINDLKNGWARKLV